MGGRVRRLLVANRGEIACRIFRTARRMGIGTVAVASEPDAGALHARLADTVVILGPGPATESYLRIERIIAAARETGADAVHPGYGFLSERPEFAAAVRDAGLTFVGPSPEAMEALGGKIRAKRLAEAAGVPVLPGLYRPGASDEELREAAEGMGYPVLLKASAGGGGRGMRAVRAAAEFDSALALAREEAERAFGDGAMMVERLVDRPRHVEVQFVADAHGGVAPLFERECSLQRRHQKLLEEAPSPWVEEDPAGRWPGMADAVRRLVAAAGYVGAGTAEFLVDPDRGEFSFLEVNARLQVEHPVTEAVTGLDLVEWQLRVAEGEALPPEWLAGDRSRLNGWAVEARVIAEDPARGFLPSVGPILGWATPDGHPGVRVDTGFGAGDEVSPHYDSLLAKVIAHGPDRPTALDRLVAALEDFPILGVATNIGFLLDLISRDDVRAGRMDVGLVEREGVPAPPPPDLPALAALARTAVGGPSARVEGAGPWAADGWRVRYR